MFVNQVLQIAAKLMKITPKLKRNYGGIIPAYRHLVRTFFSAGLQSVVDDYRARSQYLDERPCLEKDPFAGGRLQLQRNDGHSRKKGYVITAPDYVSNSAGVKCLYLLCHDLNRLGYPAYITQSSFAPAELNTPIISLDDARRLVSTDRYSALYPETVTGNPLGAVKVIRWVLNRPGLLAGEEVYDDNEKVFYYSDVYLGYIKNEVVGKLYMPTIDESIFFDDGKNERCLECYYLGKSQWKDGFFNRNTVFEITRSSPPQRELGKLFRRSKVLYNFDNSTIVTYEAIMCGCPVVVIPDGTQTWEDYRKLELGTDGIAWGIENFTQARANASLLKERYERVKQEYGRQLEQLIKLTQ